MSGRGRSVCLSVWQPLELPSTVCMNQRCAITSHYTTKQVVRPLLPSFLCTSTRSAGPIGRGGHLGVEPGRVGEGGDEGGVDVDALEEDLLVHVLVVLVQQDRAAA